MEIQLHFLLILLASGWCVFHSALIAPAVTGFFRSVLGEGYKFYRLIYNLFSLFTLIPVIFMEYGFREELIFAWDQPLLQVLRILLFILCMILFIYGGKQYDGKEFLGIAQIRRGGMSKTLSGTGSLNTGGILNVIRHPWYLGAILVIWLRNIYDTVMMVNVVFTIYLVIGSILEETKLKREFGEEYTAYQKRVSMLIPWKWLFRGRRG